MSGSVAERAARWGGRRAWLLAASVLVGLLLRLASALVQGDQVVPLPGTFDQLSYHTLALRLLDGHGFSFATPWWPATRAGEPTAHWSFLYTFYLAGVYAVVGPHPLAARLLQALIVGLLTPLLTYRLGRRIYGERAALAAAALTSGYLYFAYYAGALMTEPFYIVAILWMLEVAYRVVGGEGSWRQWGELGVAMLVGLLLRQLIMLFFPCLLGWVVWRRWQQGRGAALRRSLLGGGLAVAIVLLGVLPFTAYNALRFQRFVLLNSNAGYAFFWGNHPIHGSRFVGILPDSGPSYYELIPPELLPLDEAALDQALLRRGLAFIQAEPGRYLRLSASRWEEYFKFWPSPESSPLSNGVRVASFGLCLPWMVGGLWLSLRGAGATRPAEGRWGAGLLYLFVSVYTAIHLLTWTLVRYRLPVDGVAMLFAGLALSQTAQWAVRLKRAGPPAR